MLTRITLTERQPNRREDPDGNYSTGTVEIESDVADDERSGLQRVRTHRDDRSGLITVTVEAFGAASLQALKSIASRELALARMRADQHARSSAAALKGVKSRQADAEDANQDADSRIAKLLAKADPTMTKIKAAEIVLSEDYEGWYDLNEKERHQKADNLLHRIAEWKRNAKK